MQERLSKLAGGVAVIKVGAATEAEMNEKKNRIEDARSATRAAVEEGIVAGGGAAFIDVLSEVAALMDDATGDVRTGIAIVLRALEEPVRQIALNAGLDGGVVCERVKSADKGFGYDVLTDEVVNMVDQGIVDPAKVARSALQNAASIASTLLTTEAVVADIPEPEAPMNPGAGGMY